MLAMKLSSLLDMENGLTYTIWFSGYVPGPYPDVYSGLAEAYGIYTVVSFFLHYMQM